MFSYDSVAWCWKCIEVMSSDRSVSRSTPLLTNAELGTLLFVGSELMFFAALISAFLIIKAGRGAAFVLPAHITLPVLATGLNTVVLLVSGYLLHLATVRFKRLAHNDELARHRVERLFLAAIVGGIIFVSAQGYEWVKLLSYGMTMTSGIFAACFFLLIGTHALHVAATVAVMLFFYLRRSRLTLANLRALRMFWLFVVGVWPLLYGLVYF